MMYKPIWFLTLFITGTSLFSPPLLCQLLRPFDLDRSHYMTVASLPFSTCASPLLAARINHIARCICLLIQFNCISNICITNIIHDTQYTVLPDYPARQRSYNTLLPRHNCLFYMHLCHRRLNPRMMYSNKTSRLYELKQITFGKGFFCAFPGRLYIGNEMRPMCP